MLVPFLLWLLLLVFAITDELNQPAGAMTPIMVGLVVVAIGMSFGGLHGYAINPARDFGPRLFTVFARTKAQETGSRGVSAFLVEAPRKGLTLGPANRKMGQQGAHVCDVIFDDCRVPADATIAQPPFACRSRCRSNPARINVSDSAIVKAGNCWSAQRSWGTASRDSGSVPRGSALVTSSQTSPGEVR